MGLSIVVGALLDLADPEDRAVYDDHWNAINAALQGLGLPVHSEPRAPVAGLPLSFDMYGYSGLHYLRRLAAHIWAGNTIPEPGGDDASQDRLLTRYYASSGESLGWLGMRRPRGPRFDHLILHSDCEGSYVPVDFADPIATDILADITGSSLGSSNRLMAECEQLAGWLGLPLELDPESDEVWDAVESQGEGETQWKRYGVESFTCLRLYHAAKRSIQTGAALMFG